MQIVIDIPKDVYTRLFDNGIQDNEIAVDDVCEMARAIRNGVPISEFLKELLIKIIIEVDGGTDDKYLRYADVCDRISNTIDTYIKAECEDNE